MEGKCRHASPSLCLVIFAFSVSLDAPSLSLYGGKLSSVREAVRNGDSSSRDKDDEGSQHQDESGRLSGTRHNVRQPNSSASHSSHRREHGGHRAHHRHDHYDYGFGFAVGDYYRPPSYPPYPVAHWVAPEPPNQFFAEPLPPPVESTESVHPALPYSHTNSDESDVIVPTYPAVAPIWTNRAWFELGSDFDGLSRRTAAFMLDSDSGLGLDFRWDSFVEDLGTGLHDELHIGDLNAMFRVAESEFAQWRVGLGLTWMGDAVGTDFGFNLTIRGDVCPAGPLVISGELDLGTLGDAEMFHGSISAGVRLHRFELFGGYDYRKIGSAELYGPMIGLRLWF